MGMERLQRRLQAARGEAPADLVLTGGRVANVYTGQWQETDVALFDGIIVGLGDYPGPRLDVTGRYLLPGLIDGHLHLESSMLTPRELARALLPLGTTTVVADPHEIANVWGTAGLDYLLAASDGLPLDFFFMLPSCVPASPLETAGARLEAGDLEPYRRHPRVLGLAEVMNFPGVVAGDPGLLDKIALFPRGPVDGHAPLLSGKGAQCLPAGRDRLRPRMHPTGGGPGEAEIGFLPDAAGRQPGQKPGRPAAGGDPGQPAPHHAGHR